jgi:Lrp/AsnC family leucine-responsive transcriptional regulator
METNLVAFVFVRTDSRERNAAALLARIPQVVEVHRVAGEDCYLLKVCLTSTVELGRLVKEKIERIKSVCDTRTTIVLRTLKDRGNPLSVCELDLSRTRSIIGER